MRRFWGKRLNLFGDYLDGASLGGAFALSFVEDFLSQPEILWGGFYVFVGADVFQGALE